MWNSEKRVEPGLYVGDYQDVDYNYSLETVCDNQGHKNR